MEIKHNFVDDTVVLQVGRFSILWNEFERQFTNCGTKRLQDVYMNIRCDTEACEELRRELYAQQILNADAPDFIRDFFYTDYSNRKPNAQEKEAIHAFINCASFQEEQLCGCLLVIYRFRNNLLHGIKSMHSLPEQQAVFDIISRILESVEPKLP